MSVLPEKVKQRLGRGTAVGEPQSNGAVHDAFDARTGVLPHLTRLATLWFAVLLGLICLAAARRKIAQRA